MAVIGANVLARRGYSGKQIRNLDIISRQIGRDVIVRQAPGRTLLAWDYPIGSPAHSYHLQAGIRGSWRGDIGAWEVYEPEFQRRQLTETETRAVLPIARPHGERVSFNPFDRRSRDLAVGTFNYPEAPQRKGEIFVRTLQPQEIEPIVKRLQRGERVEFHRWGKEIKRPPTFSHLEQFSRRSRFDISKIFGFKGGVFGNFWPKKR